MLDPLLQNDRSNAPPALPMRLAEAVAGSQLAVVLTEADGDHPIVFVNAAFERLTGYAGHEVVGRNCRFMQGPDTDPGDLARVRAVLRGGDAASVDILNYRKNGETFWNALYISPVIDAEGRTAGYFGAQLDASDRKRAEHELEAVRRDLASAVQARTRELSDTVRQKTTLLHEVDHRVKNNLQLIASLVMLQIRRTPEESAKQALRSMLERIAAVSTIHRRLFQSADVERFDIADFLSDLLEERLGVSADDDSLDVRLERLSLPNAKAAPLALIVSELISYVAGGPGYEPGLRVSAAVEGGQIRLSVEGRSREADGDAFGREITELLTRQLQGSAKFEERDGLRRAYLTLPMNGA